jgi:hypothetical protein
MALISFTGSPHGGSHKLLPEWNRQPRITPTTIIGVQRFPGVVIRRD